jgi:hypothetical protein
VIAEGEFRGRAGNDIISNHCTAKVSLDPLMPIHRYLKTRLALRGDLATPRTAPFQIKIKGGLIMFRSRVRPLFASLAIAISLASGCASDRSSLASPSGQSDSTNVVQRPTYEVEGTKPLYLGGYAGANYRAPAQAGR